jgi:hypothetical protein
MPKESRGTLQRVAGDIAKDTFDEWEYLWQKYKRHMSRSVRLEMAVQLSVELAKRLGGVHKLPPFEDMDKVMEMLSHHNRDNLDADHVHEPQRRKEDYETIRAC